MSVEARDIIFYGSANMQETDTGTQGGAIDKAVKMVWSDLTALSSKPVTLKAFCNATMTGTVITVTGRDASGQLISEAIPTAGVTPTASTAVFERLLKCVISGTVPTATLAVCASTAVRSSTAQTGGDTVSIVLDAAASAVDDYYKGMVLRPTGAGFAGAQNQVFEIVKYTGATKIAYLRTAAAATLSVAGTYEIYEGMTFEISLGTHATRVSQCRRPFYNVAADPSAAKTYYEKVFVFNNNTLTSLATSTINEQATGIYAKVAYALASTFGQSDAQTSTNRVTVPGAGIGAWKENTDNDVALPNSQNFTFNDGCGVWLRLSLSAGDTAQNSYYEMQVKGQTV